MRPQVKSTIILSLLGLSVALNVAMAIGYVRGTERPIAHATRADDEDYCLLDELELDAEQKRRLAEMRRTMQEARAAYWRRASTIKAELAEAILAAHDSSADVHGQLERYAENQAAMQRAVAEHLHRVNAMLRPEQRETFRTLLRTEMFRGIRPSRTGPEDAP